MNSIRAEAAIDAALATLPSARYLIASHSESKRSGQLLTSIMWCAREPRLVCVAAIRGHGVEPLIRDSHAFGLSAVDPSDKLVHRTFSEFRPPDEGGDPFESLSVETLVTGSPILRKSPVVLDCELVRHLDLEADHSLYIGRVVAARCIAGKAPPPQVHLVAEHTPPPLPEDTA